MSKLTDQQCDLLKIIETLREELDLLGASFGATSPFGHAANSVWNRLQSSKELINAAIAILRDHATPQQRGSHYTPEHMQRLANALKPSSPAQEGLAEEIERMNLIGWVASWAMKNDVALSVEARNELIAALRSRP